MQRPCQISSVTNMEVELRGYRWCTANLEISDMININSYKLVVEKFEAMQFGPKQITMMPNF